jgi:protein-disulfide isomerase
MRLNRVKSLRSVVVAGVVAMTLCFSAAPLVAQRSVPPGSGDLLKDIGIFKPPAGARVAVIEFQDLQCPACAAAFPIVHQAVSHYNIALIEKDFPLPQHAVLGSLDAAVWARYLQVKVSTKVADDYRGAYFAGQGGIQNKDDTLNFTRRFFQSHGLQMPFVADPSGELMKMVQADKQEGQKIGIQHTPTIIVCNSHEWVQVAHPTDLYQTIDELLAKAGPAAPAKTAGPTKTAH